MLDINQILALHLFVLSSHKEITKEHLRLIEQLEPSMGSLCELIKSLDKKYSTERAADLLSIADKQIVGTMKRDVRILSFFDPNYPKRLKKLSNPPLILFVKGDQSALNVERVVAVVGAREATDRAKEMATNFSRDIALTGACIVSGLAMGCDAAAHTGALDSQVGKTIAVMAHGLDMVYPSENKSLATRILAEGGCLVSIYPLGEKPNRDKFLDRNGIQTGLSDSTLIIQAIKVQSGTMATAKHCKEQRRILFCVNPSLDATNQAKYAGNKKLIRDGVRQINSNDITNFINILDGLMNHDASVIFSTTARKRQIPGAVEATGYEDKKRLRM